MDSAQDGALLHMSSLSWGCDKWDPRSPTFWEATYRNKADSHSLRQKVDDLRFTTTAGKAWGWFVLLLNVLTAILFVFLQYSYTIRRVDGPFAVVVRDHEDQLNTLLLASIMYGISWIYVLDFSCRFISAMDRFAFFFDRTGYMLTPSINMWDLVAICAVQAAYYLEDDEEASPRYDLSLFSCVRVLYVCEAAQMIFEMMRANKRYPTFLPHVQRTVIDTSVTACTIVYIGAALFMHIENWSSERDPKLDFFDAIYFIVVTMTTVGYGDIFPTSTLSRGYVCVLMLYLATLLFPKILNLAEDLSKLTPFNSKLGQYDYQPVIMWQNNHHPSVEKLVTLGVAVADVPPSGELETFLNIRRQHCINYVQGSLLQPETCHRAGVQYAKACILLQDEDSECGLIDDEELCLVAMHVRQYTDDFCMENHQKQHKHNPDKPYEPLDRPNHPMRIVLSLDRAQSVQIFTGNLYGATPDEIPNELEAISLPELKMQAMAKGLTCPGFPAFISNLMTHMYDCDGDLKGCTTTHSDWMDEYTLGASQQYHTVHRDKVPTDIEFAKLAAFVYAETGAMMMVSSDGVNNGEFEGKKYALFCRSVAEAKEIERRIQKIRDDPVAKEKLLENPIFRESSDITPSLGKVLSQDQICDLFVPTHGDEARLELEGRRSEERTPNCFRHTENSPEEDLRAVFSSQESSGFYAEWETDFRLHHAYAQVGFKASFGLLEHFAMRHVVHDPYLRDKYPDAESENEMPALIQDLNSKVVAEASNHIILLGGDLCHVPHFVRVLRTIDVPASKRCPVMIITESEPTDDICLLLRMFADVTIVVITDHDGCCKTATGAGHSTNITMVVLMRAQVTKASQVVFAATKGHMFTEVGVRDFHLLNLRLLIRNLNPAAETFVELDDYNHVRLFMFGTEKVNPFVKNQEGVFTQSDEDNLHHQHVVCNEQWAHREPHVNRAACVAGGGVMEMVRSRVRKQLAEYVLQDMLVPLLALGVHRSLGAKTLQSFIGGSIANLSLTCVELPPEYVDKEYLDLVVNMCLHDYIPLALYRTCPKELQQYIYTNPSRQTKLRANDKVYILNHYGGEFRDTAASKEAAMRQSGVTKLDRSLSSLSTFSRGLSSLGQMSSSLSPRWHLGKKLDKKPGVFGFCCSAADRLQTGSDNTKRDAIAMLGVMSKHEKHVGTVVAAGAVQACVAVLQTGSENIKQNAITVLNLISKHEQHVGTVVAAGAVEAFVAVLQTGSDNTKQNAADAVLDLISKHEHYVGTVVAAGAVEACVAVQQTGPENVKLTAAAVLASISQHEQYAGTVVAASAMWRSADMCGSAADWP